MATSNQIGLDANTGGLYSRKTAVEHVVSGFRSLLETERALHQLTSEAGDEGSNALMSDYIRQQEKLVGMYSAYLK